MATCSSVCMVCDLQHQTTQSTHWCIECDEPLCSACKQHHNVLKVTRNHETIPISDYQSLPAVVTDIKQNCVDHKERYQLYCKTHESPICNKCVKDHWKCEEILSLGELVKDIKKSESFVDLHHSLDVLLDTINQIRKDKESNMESITDQKKKIDAQVSHLKNQVIQHVNKLEEEFIKELNQIELEYCNPIRSSVSSLQDKAKEITQLNLEIKNTKKYASNLQTFLSMRTIQEKTNEYEKDLQYFNENEYNETVKIESTIDTKIQDILTVDKFGSINVKKGPSPNIDLQRRKDRQAQIRVSKAINSIYGVNDVKLKLIRKFNTTCKFSSGCCVTQTGDFLFTDSTLSNEKVVTINDKGKVQYTIPLENQYGVFDVACIDDSTVALSALYYRPIAKPGISIVDLMKRKTIKFIDLPASPSGITYDGKSLICCVKDKDLHVISFTDYSITTIPNTALPCYSYVSTYADKIFLINTDKHKVICCLYSGALVWEFKDESVLQTSRGIIIDNNGIVFVVGGSSCSMVVISPDGKHCKQILTKDGGLDRPTGIFFDKARNQLLVTNKNQFAYIYDMSYI